MKRFVSAFAVLAIIAVAAGIAQATSIAVFDSDTASFGVSATDVPGTGATVTGGGWAGSAASLNNASAAEAVGGAGSLELGIGAGAGLEPGASITYTLNLTNAASGWDISQITTYASWASDVGGRSRQGYSVTATLIDNSVVSVLAAQTYIDGTDKAATKVDITGLGLTGVKSLTFGNFAIAPNGSMGNIFHEVDVFGTATVPEPGTLALCATGLIGLLCYAWRKQK